MKFELKNTRQVGWDGIKGWVYNDKEHFENASAVYFEVTGSHGKVKTTKSDRVYFVLEGQGEFTFNDEVIPVKATDVIIVPKNTPYDYEAKDGIMRLFLVHTPAYDKDAEEKLN